MTKIFVTDYESKLHAISEIRRIVDYTKPLQVTIEAVKRTNAMNNHQWPILSAFAEQLKWPINGQMTDLTAENWKDILTAAFRKETPRVAISFDGAGLVMLGLRTREFKKDEWPDWIEFLTWAAAEKGIKIPASKQQIEAWGIDAGL